MNGKCVLCGELASIESRDADNVTSVRCTSSDCGNYEATNSALRKINESEAKTAWALKACRLAKASGKVAHFYINDKFDLVFDIANA